MSREQRVTKTAPSVLDRVESFVKVAPDALSRVREHRQQLLQQVDALKRAGMVEASPHYREDKYLYLVHPQKAGQRKREYIGSDPKKIAAALARVERFERHSKLVSELAELDRSINALSYGVADVDSALRRLMRAAGSH